MSGTVENGVFYMNHLVTPQDVVSEYNHVHHAQIVSIFEKGRLALLEHIKCPQDGLVSEGYFLVVSRIEVQFLREIILGEYLVTCEDIRTEGKRLDLKQRIVSQARGKDMARADVTLMVVRRGVGRSVDIPGHLIDGLNPLKK